MKRKKLVGYGALIITIILLSLLMPYGIERATDFFVGSILKEALESTETEMEDETKQSGNTRLALEGNGIPTQRRAEGMEPPSETEAIFEEQEEKEQYDQELMEYRKTVRPKYSELVPGAKISFLPTNKREEQLALAVADYLYALYDDTLTVNEITVMEFVEETEALISYQIEVLAGTNQKAYSESFIASYNKVQDFYSLYPGRG